MNRLEQIADLIQQAEQPPVHTWKPKIHGAIDITIDQNGFWQHEGEPIQRAALVKLFASILWAENGKHYLVTPAEKLEIQVSDSPYIVHQMEYVENAWIAVTNTHEQIIIGADNPVELRQFHTQWVPYIKVRYDLWARVNRSIYYQWVEAAIELQSDENQTFELCSQGYRFEVARV